MAKITQVAKQSLSYSSVYTPQKEAPQSFYINELSVAPSKELVDKLALINQQQFKADKVNESAFAKGTGSFGVLNYVDTTYTLFEKAKQGIQSLQLELVDSDETIIAKTKRYIESAYESSYFDNNQLDTFFGQFVDSSKSFSFNGLSDINGLTAIESESHQALFKTGTYIKDDVRLVQKLRSQLVAFRHQKERKVTQLKAELAKINAQIPKEQQRLSALNNQRLKSLSDYQVARQLVSEDWQNVENAYRQRAHILDNHLGISFVKVRESNVSKTLQGQAMLGVNRDDLVPGCPLQDSELPESIEPFLEAILEIPVSNWRYLKDYYQQLPQRQKVLALLEKRHYRVDYQLQYQSFTKLSALSQRMIGLRAANKALIQESVQRQVIYSDSLVSLQQSAIKVLSIEDLLNGPPHRLRHQCEAVRNKIDQATHCFITQLQQLSPWIRLQWASSAEQDTLQINSPKTWPQADQALADNPNAMLTLGAIVQWWFDQLIEDADQSSVLAISHLLRASLLYSASDDPNEVLHGQLSKRDTTLKLGHQIRVDLNMEAHTGTLLQVVDAHNQLLATLRVDDVDDNGTLTTVTQMQGQDAVVISNADNKGNYKVTGYAAPVMKSAVTTGIR
jgi:hypothetical protein